MSLFSDGDGTSRAISEDSITSSNEQTTKSVPSVQEGAISETESISHAQPRFSQAGPASTNPYDLNADDDILASSPYELFNESAEAEERRQNRHRIPARTWLRWTEDSRRVATSAQQLHGEDLSVHLYNAHALKRRLYPRDDRDRDRDREHARKRTWLSKDRWIRAAARGSGDDDDDDADGRNWVPPKLWTAWPLEPDEVPRPGERFAAPRDDRDDAFTVRMPSREYASTEMEQALFATLLRRVKVQGKRREWEGGVNPWTTKEWNTAFHDLPRWEEYRFRVPSKEETKQRRKGGATDRATRATEQETSTTKQALEPTERATGESLKSIPPPSPSSSLSSSPSSSPSASSSASSSRSPDGASEVKTTERASETTTQTRLRPVPLADDEKAETILRPIIRSVLSKLDGLLMALHHSAENTRGTGSQDDVSETENDTDTRSPGRSVRRQRSTSRAQSTSRPGRPRSVGRPKKPVMRAATSSAPTSAAEETETTDASGPRRKGRPRKWPKPLPGESYYMMRKRLAEEAARAAGTAGSSEDEEAGPQAAEVVDEAPSAPPSPLSDASVVDDRAPKRRRSSSRPRTTNPRDWSEILGTAMLLGWDAAAVDRAARRCAALFGEGVSVRTLRESAVRKRTAGELVEYAPETIAPFSSDESSSEGDGSHDEDHAFFTRHRLTDHLKRVHDHDTIEDDEDSSDMCGGVHVDGFLEPIAASQGWRAKDLVLPSERRKNAAKRRQELRKQRNPGF